MAWTDKTLNGNFGRVLYGVLRCPHCMVAAPLLELEWNEPAPINGERQDGDNRWGAYRCSSCKRIVTVRTRWIGDRFGVHEMYPEPRSVSEEIPDSARLYLSQAIEILHAPDAAVMIAASAVDAMLKHFGLVDGSLFARIDQAVEENILTAPMGKWAHVVRLEANRTRHADSDNPHVTREEAEQTVEFAQALGHFLFVVSARIDRGLTRARSIFD